MAVRINYSFQEFYDLIKDKINEKSKKPSFWGEGSITRAIVQSFAYLAEFLQSQINIAFSSFRIKTAKGLHLELRVKDFDMEKKQATYALATQTFVGASGRLLDIVIPSGTIVATEPNELGNTITYELVDDITLLASASSVDGLVRCTQLGTIGNVDENKITVIVSNLSQIESTTNAMAVGNGANAETSDQLRERVPSHLLGLQSGNEDSIKSACYAVEGVTYVEIKDNYPSDGNFAVLISTENGIVDPILVELVKEALRRVRAFCITYSVITPSIKNIPIELDIEINANLYNKNELLTNLKLLLLTYINASRRSKVTQAEIIKLLMSQSNVMNVKNVIIDGVEEDLELAEFYVAKIDSINDITFNVTEVI